MEFVSKLELTGEEITALRVVIDMINELYEKDYRKYYFYEIFTDIVCENYYDDGEIRIKDFDELSDALHKILAFSGNEE